MTSTILNQEQAEAVARLTNAVGVLNSVRTTLTALRTELERLEPDTERAWTASVHVAAMINNSVDAEQQLHAASRELSK